MDPIDLDAVKDRKDKLVSKLFTMKIKDMCDDDSNVLHKCVYCNKLFTAV